MFSRNGPELSKQESRIVNAPNHRSSFTTQHAGVKPGVKLRRDGSDHHTTLNAVAFQDQILRKMNVNLSFAPPKPPIGLSQTRENREKLRAERKSRGNQIASGKVAKIKPWHCKICGQSNADTENRCTSCLEQREDKKYIFQPSKLTLAQMRGLEEKPESKLSVEQWQDLERRANARGDTTSDCAICREPFRMEDQVMLSCSHVFHRACLASFEKFLCKKERTCPLCRKTNYQKMITSTGAKAYRQRSIAKIQAHVRGFITRRFYRKLLRDFFKKGGGDLHRRRHFFGEELGRYTEKITKSLKRNEDSLDALFAEFDKNLAISRQVMGGGNASDLEQQLHGLYVHEWQGILLKATGRGDQECPICMVELDCTTIGYQNQILLSCTHLFHSKCISAFEDFNIYEINLCPVCRNAYKRALVSEIRATLL